MATVGERDLRRYWIRTVRIGCHSTAAVLLILGPLIFIPGGAADPTFPVLALMGVAGLGALVSYFLPWDRLFTSGLGLRLLYAWSIVDIAVITMFLVVVGPTQSGPFLLYAFPTIFFAASYPRRSQILLFVYTAASYLAVWALFAGSEPITRALFRIAALGIVAFMASYMSRELMRQMAEHSRARDEAQQATSLLRATLEATADGILVVDTAGQIVAFNEKFARMWRIPRDVLDSRDDDRAIAVVLDQLRNPDAFLSKVRALYEGDEESFDVLEFKDGRVFERYSLPRRLGGATGEIVGRVWSFRDVTAQRTAQRALENAHAAVTRADHEKRRLLTHLVSAKEQERKRVASDIHDDSIQVMTSLVIGLEQLAKETPDPERRVAIQRYENLARDAVGRLRTMVFKLRPPALDREGLATALRLYLEELHVETGIEYTLSNELTSDLASRYRTALYRIAQEALTNVRKHANASNVVVTLDDREGEISLRIEDDGVGLSLREATDEPMRHIGITEMRERAEMMGGRLDLLSTPGKGTVVDVWLPAATQEHPAEAPQSGVV